jgi:hypothetical protein
MKIAPQDRCLEFFDGVAGGNCLHTSGNALPYNMVILEWSARIGLFCSEDLMLMLASRRAVYESSAQWGKWSDIQKRKHRSQYRK